MNKGVYVLTFNKGDVVQLKSGGPKMTVVDIGEQLSGSSAIWCTWFVHDGKKDTVEQATFPPEALEKSLL